MDTMIRVTLAIVVVAGSIVTAGPIAAQNYPTKPIRMIVPYAPGGAADIAARNAANELGLQLGQQIVVDNRPGANGIIGWEMLARAVPDGYTIGFVANGLTTNSSLYSKLPYDSKRDFQPIILFGSNANLLTVTSSLPVRSVKELIEQARAKPDALSYGSSGVGTSPHLTVELLKAITSTSMVHVLYKGIPQAHTDLIGGRIHVMCDVVYSILPQVRAGKVRALGVTSLKRSPIAPEVPTFEEAGIPGYEVTNWSGYAFPSGTPRNLVLRLNAELNKVLSLPSMVKSFADRGSIVLGGTPERLAEHMQKETEKWGKIIKEAGIKAQ